MYVNTYVYVNLILINTMQRQRKYVSNQKFMKIDKNFEYISWCIIGMQ